MLATTPVSARDRDALLVTRLRSRKPGATIVYVTLQKTAERVAAALSDAGLQARPYHAGMESEERHQVQEWWMESDCRIAVATIAFGMGIDKADVRYVYHYNMPKSLESYSQEIGRAGRDDKPSVVEMLPCPDDIPTLENFGYGDTPTIESLQNLVDDVLSAGDEFDISLYDVSNRHDLRILVLRTALTYLELLGVIRQGTPFYAGYEFAPKQAKDWIIAQFTGEPAQLVRDLFQRSKFGKKWYSLNPDDFANAVGVKRNRVVRALEYLEEHGWIELRVADLRNKYYCEPGVHDGPAIARELYRRYERREHQEAERLQQVIALVTSYACQTNYLVGHFGETRAEPCGHCTFCRTGRAQTMPPPSETVPVPGGIDTVLLDSLREKYPKALASPRQAARFLCGLTSPATSAARLGRNPLFGALEGARFGDVLAWLEETAHRRG
jgi:ATP-dependent DNA helicase RecQ